MATTYEIQAGKLASIETAVLSPVTTVYTKAEIEAAIVVAQSELDDATQNKVTSGAAHDITISEKTAVLEALNVLLARAIELGVL